MASKDRYNKTDDKLTAFGAIDFGNSTFNHAIQIRDTLFINFFVTGTGMETLETQAFVAICDRLFLAFYFVNVRALVCVTLN